MATAGSAKLKDEMLSRHGTELSAETHNDMCALVDEAPVHAVPLRGTGGLGGAKTEPQRRVVLCQ